MQHGGDAMHRKAIAFFAGFLSVAFFLLTQADRFAHFVIFSAFRMMLKRR
jgi:hypothetical protein